MNAEKNEEHHQRKTLKKVWKQKIKNIENALDRGEDINVAENDKRNTLLHTAVLNAEVDVVKCLLNKKADITIKNSAEKTALDIAELLKCSNGKQIVSLLRKYQNGNYHPTRLEINSDSQQKQLKNKPKLTKNKSCLYQKRTGSSGINGQHYETKLLSLILLRALHDSGIEEFYLGTNVADLGAFDDIVLRYKKHGEKQINIVFLQAKHIDDPHKHKVSVGDTLNEDGNFSLHKYLESYMVAHQKFCSDSKNEMFKGSLNNLNCEFIIYTPAIENFDEQTVMTQTEGENYIRTSESGKICHFHANDIIIAKLAPTVKKTLAKKIAERLANFKNQKTVIMMTDDITKVYHVFLAQHVLDFEPKKHGKHGTLQDQDNKSNNLYIKVKFRQSFRETKDEHLLHMKNIICKDLKILKGKTAAEIEDRLKSLTFEVPANFGNVDFHIKEDEKEKEETLKYFCTIFDKLFAEDCIVEIKESDIGSDKILQSTDIDKLGSLVGNLLILDLETKLLKFNLEKDHLSNDSLRLLKLLYKNNDHISRYRLDVMIPWFPKLVLSKDEDDKNLVTDFLKQLKFYTNQAKEDEVEVLLRKEIDLLYNLKDDSIFRARSDAIFLKFHAQVQSWWKQPGWTEYLEKSCEFYNEAKRDTLDSPLLSILNYTNSNKMKTYGTKFKPSAINALKITDFLKDDNANVLFVVSNEITLSSIKCFQYFGENYDNRHTFLDLESVISNHYLEIVEKELKDTKCNVLVIIDKTGSASQVIFHAVKKAFHGKIVLITSANISDNLKNKLSYGVIQRIDDNTNIFTDLENEIRDIILKRELLFQGQKVSVAAVLNTEFLRAVKPIIIHKFINNKTIVVGQMLTDKPYKTSNAFYINRSLCRYVTLNKQNEENNTYLYSINEGVPESVKPEHDCDIILITEHEDYFKYICNENENRNVHWFKFKHEITGSNNIVWFKSKGQLMIKDKDRGLKVTYQVMPKTVTDIEERMVLITGESGMGKSTFLSNLAVHTKQKYPTMWVSKINFQDHFKQFIKWKSDKTNIDLVEVFKFLYGAIDINSFKDNAEAKQNILEEIGNRIVINNVNEIHINKIDLEADLFEIYVFNHCYNNKRVVLLFDGFDEVCSDYEHEAIQFLSTLKSSKVAHIWVTTRPYNFINELQCALGFLLFKIMPFNQLEKVQCLKKIWTRNLGLAKEMSASSIDRFLCNSFCSMTITDITSRIDESFTGVPLHIYLIADYFQNDFEKYLTDARNMEPTYQILVPLIVYKLRNFNLYTLYEKFIEKIFFTIHLGEKTSSADFNDPKLRKILEKEHKDFLNDHKKISAYTLFGEGFVKERFSFEDFQSLNNLMEDVKLGDEKAGIIECIIDNRPKFVHPTFCEYFATEFIFDILKSDSCTSSFWQYLLTDIFVADNKSGIRKFIESKLSEKDLFHETFYTKYSTEVLEILLSQSSLLQFEVAIKEGVINVTIFILNCARSAINKDNLQSLIKLSSKEIGDALFNTFTDITSSDVNVDSHNKALRL